MASDQIQTLERETDAPAEVSDAAKAAALAGLVTLSACGGGGGGGGGGTSPPPPPPAPAMTEAQASRFLLQAQFSATDGDVNALKANGMNAWLDGQFSAALGITGVDWLTSQGHNSITSEARYFWPQFGDFMIWNQLLAGPDQMRKRMALALSEFFVVSLSPIDGFYPPYMIAAYWDLLTANAFGNFRTLLEKITLNAAMGFFLNTKGNLKEDPVSGREPDENYAREVMQLFTIGLYELNNDGTEKLDASNKPIETYGQSDITNLARVFTGYDYNFSHTTFTPVAWVNYSIPSFNFAVDPMSFDANNHSNLEVNFLGTNIPAGSSGANALKIALDRLFNHPNTGPFFAKQMIQRLVTSNPSPAYVNRVANVFNNNGSGTRGDLKAVWRAILTDSEATTPTTDPLGGKLREPVVRFISWARTVGFTSTTGAYEIYDLSAADQALGQSAVRSPSVFNFFRPGYVPPHTALATANKGAPEFQLHNETTTAGTINFLEWMIRWGYNDVKPTYTNMLSFAHDTTQVVSYLNVRLAGSQLSSTTQTTISTALTSLGITASSSNDAKMNLLASACLLVLSSPEYLIQK
ncbi:MAG: DUF1800 domain-containing protein [Pseudomonadota bacterium]